MTTGDDDGMLDEYDFSNAVVTKGEPFQAAEILRLRKQLDAALCVVENCGAWWYATVGRVPDEKRDIVRKLVLARE